MVLRDLADRTIRLGQDRGDLGKHGVGDVEPAILRWHGDRQKAGLGEKIQFGKRQDPVGVALGCACGKLRRQSAGGGDRLIIAADTVGHGPDLICLPQHGVHRCLQF